MCKGVKSCVGLIKYGHRGGPPLREKWYQKWIKEEFPEAGTLRTEGKQTGHNVKTQYSSWWGQRRSLQCLQHISECAGNMHNKNKIKQMKHTKASEISYGFNHQH